MTKTRWLCAAMVIAMSFALGACQKLPEAETKANNTPAPTLEPAPTTAPTAVPPPPEATITLTSEIKDDKAVDALTEVENAAGALTFFATVQSVTEPASFYIEITEPDLTTQKSAPTELATDGVVSGVFEAPAAGWKLGEYTASIWKDSDAVPLNEFKFTVKEALGPVVDGLTYMPEPNLRLRGFWAKESNPEGSWITAKLDDRPFEGYLLSQCYKDDPKYIIDYYVEGDAIWANYSDGEEPIEYLPLKIRLNMEWTCKNESLRVSAVDASFTIRGAAYENCVELVDTISNEDGTQTVLHLIYAPQRGLIYEWAEPSASDDPTFYVKGVEPFSQEKALEVFTKVPGFKPENAQ